jgi:hypothetical protein
MYHLGYMILALFVSWCVGSEASKFYMVLWFTKHIVYAD